MDATTPSAHFQPNACQYTPTDSSIENNVPALVKPRSSSFPLVRMNAITILNFQRNNAIAPRTPVRRVQAGRGCSGFAGPWRPSSAMRSLTAAYCLLSGGSRSSAVRQATRAWVKRPARLCSSASPARRLRSSENRSQPHAGHTSSAAATSVPQLGHASKTGLLGWRGGRRDPVWSRDAQLHSAVELPRFVEGEPDDQNPDGVFEAREKRRRIENPEQHDNTNGEAERANRFGLCHNSRRILNGLGVGGSRSGRRHLRRSVLANSLDDERDVRCHDGGVGEKDRQRLIPPPAPAIRAFAHGATDDESHGDGNNTQLIARHFEDDVPQDGTGYCRQDPKAESGDEATCGSPSVPLRFDRPAASVAQIGR